MPCLSERTTIADVNTPTAEQRRRFERLWLLRSLYARRGPRDSTSVMPLDEVEAYARALIIDAYWRANAARPAGKPA